MMNNSVYPIYENSPRDQSMSTPEFRASAAEVSRPDASPELYHGAQSLFKPFDVAAYCSNLRLSAPAEAFVREAALAPSRSPNGYLSNTVRYPCPVNGHTITAESTRYEFPFFLTITNRPDVIRVFEQGPKVVIRSKTSAGQPVTFSCTVDAVVCTETGVEVYEVMAASEVAHECTEKPHRFQCIGAHKYGSKPVADHFADWGFKHYIVTEHDLDPNYVRSADFLRPYRKGFAQPLLTGEEVNAVKSAIAGKPGIYLKEIPIEPHSRRAEVIYHLIAKGEIFTHLSEGRLTKQEELRLYPTALQESAFALLRKTAHKKATDLRDLGYRLRVGSLIDIKGEEFYVECLDRDSLILTRALDGTQSKITFEALLDLKPLIGKIVRAEKTFESKLREASPEALIEMLSKHAILQKALAENSHPAPIPSRTVRRWKANVRKREAVELIGIEALLPTKSGNTRSRVDAKLEPLLTRLIERDYLTPDGRTAWWIFLHLTAINNRFKLGVCPTYRTVARRCRALDPYRKTLPREGKRGAERFKPIYPKNGLLGSPTGVKSWQYAHCDSTTCDLLNNEDGTVVRLHLIKMVDSFDGRVLCHCLTEEAPSEVTARKVLIVCAERHRMLPATVTFDWGPEGRPTWLQMTLEGLGVTVIYRPKATPRSGANIETMFRKLCHNLLHNLRGSMKLRQKARMLTRAVDPRDRAVWTIAALRQLLEEYYDLENNLPRRNRLAPNRVAEESIARYGMPPTQVPEPSAFRWALLPFANGTNRIVSKRGVVRCNDRGYYHDELRRYVGRSVQVRSDEDDIQHVYVTLPDQGRRTVVCEVVDTALKYATPDEAMEIHRRVREEIAASKAEVIAERAQFVVHVDRLQRAQIAAVKRRERSKPENRDKLMKPEQEAAPSHGKVVAMPIQFKRVIRD